MSRFAPALVLVTVAVFSFQMAALRAEDGTAEFERRLAARYAELQMQQLEAKIKTPPNASAEVLAGADQLRACEAMMARQLATAKEALNQKLADIDAQMQKAKAGRKEDMDQAKLQLLDPARTAILRKLMELEIGMPLPPDDTPAVKKMAATGQNSSLHVKLANGAELHAEGQWLETAAKKT